MKALQKDLKSCLKNRLGENMADKNLNFEVLEEVDSTKFPIFDVSLTKKVAPNGKEGNYVSIKLQTCFLLFLACLKNRTGRYFTGVIINK